MTQRKKKVLETFMNSHFEKELTLFYGEESKIKINEIKYLTQKKRYLIDITMMVTNTEISPESFPFAVEHYLSESCKILNFFPTPPVILSSIDFKND
jgi:hypothetical protein